MAGSFTIVHVCTGSISIGGAERCLVDLVREEMSLGFAPIVVLRKPGIVSDMFKSIGATCVFLRFFSWYEIKNSHTRPSLYARLRRETLGRALQLANEVRLARILLAKNASLVHINTSASKFGALAAKFTKRPLVWHVREFSNGMDGAVFSNPAKSQALIVGSARVIAVSRAIASHLEGYVPKQKLRVVYDAVQEPENDSGCKVILVSKTATIACIGRMQESKGQADLIEALAQLDGDGFGQFEVYFVGSANKGYLEELKEAAIALGVDDRVSFVGEVDDVYEWLLKSDMLVNCSRCESFGRVTVEGLHAGCLVIGNDSTGTHELLQGGAGLLYDNSKEGKDLATVLLRAIENPDRSREIAKTGREFARKFSDTSASAREVISVFEEVAQEAKCR